MFRGNFTKIFLHGKTVQNCFTHHHSRWCKKSSPLYLDIHNKQGTTPFNLVSQIGAVKVIRLLLEQVESLKLDLHTGSTSLIQASHFGHINIVHILLEHGTLVDQANYRSTMALTRAAQEGQRILWHY